MGHEIGDEVVAHYMALRNVVDDATALRNAVDEERSMRGRYTLHALDCYMQATELTGQLQEVWKIPCEEPRLCEAKERVDAAIERVESTLGPLWAAYQSCLSGHPNPASFLPCIKARLQRGGERTRAERTRAVEQLLEEGRVTLLELAELDPRLVLGPDRDGIGEDRHEVGTCRSERTRNRGKSKKKKKKR